MCNQHCFLYGMFQLEKQKEKLSGSQLWLSMPARFKFYLGCAETFRKHSVSSVKVVEYFEVRTVDLEYCVVHCIIFADMV